MTDRGDELGDPPRRGAQRLAGRYPRIAQAIRRFSSNLADPATALPLLLIGAFVLRILWLDVPPKTLIFDESYYVNAARVILGLSVDAGAPYAGSTVGLDPNIEHPPLGKVLMAASMTVFGDNGLGWRLPSVMAGPLVLAALYGIVRSAGGSAHLALLAVGFLAFDNLTLVHSRIGTLDMLVLAAILVGAWFALRDHWVLAGVAVGVGLLFKLTAVYALLALLILALIKAAEQRPGGRRAILPDVRNAILLITASSAVALAGLWLLDSRFTTFATPIDHIAHMASYGVSLGGSVDHGGFCVGITSEPWQWPFNTCQINYLRVDETVQVAGGGSITAASIDFRGAINPLLAGAIPLAVLFTVWLAWRTTDALARWSVVWIASNYLPFVALAIVSDRVMYLYYFLPVLPAAAVAVAVFLTRSGLPRFVAGGYIAAYAAGFAAYFPFRQVP